MRIFWGAALTCASMAVASTQAQAQASGALTQGLSATEQQQILAIDNATRAAVTEARPALVSVTWNATLAAQAQAYATTLATSNTQVHENSQKLQSGWNVGVGENLSSVYTDHLATPAELTKGWIDEGKNNFRYAAFPATNVTTTDAHGNVLVEGSGHYLQMVWDWGRQIGCGAAAANAMLEGHAVIRRVLVCRFLRGGNMANTYPYYTAANPVPGTVDPIVDPVWTSEADMRARREQVATTGLQSAMLPYLNGYRTSVAQVSWDGALATAATAEAQRRAGLSLSDANGAAQWGDLVSLVSDDSGYADMYPDAREGFGKSVGWNPWMPGAIANQQFTRVGCGTATHDWNQQRYRVTICRFAA